MSYQVSFAENEFRCITGHYSIEIGGKRILYAYIRKNACTTFKNMINRNTHPLFKAMRMIGLERNALDHIDGNMKYSKKWLRPWTDFSKYDDTVFVYRDPVQRAISVYTNKFVDQSGIKMIRLNYETRTGKSFEEASFNDFVSYMDDNFADIDCHLWPQKSHLWEIEYSRPVKIQNLKDEMSTILGKDVAEKWFGKKVNSSAATEAAEIEGIADMPASKLRELKRDGANISIKNFVTDEFVSFVHEKYEQDYDMLAQIGPVAV